MRLKYTLIFLLFVSLAQAQNLTGVWRGHFVSQHTMYGATFEERYRYEIQLNHLFNNALQGVTYSYNTTVFYGKTSLQGIFTKGTKNVLIKELKMLEMKISDMSEPCMMTCNLEYSKTGSKETLVGTFTSINMKKMDDCGGGMVYLEKVPESDFEKEEFLLKKKPTPESSKITPLPYNNPSTKKTYPIAPKSPLPPATTGKPKYKPGAEDALNNNKKDIAKPKLDDNNGPIEDKVNNSKKTEPKPLAKELTDRTNNLVKTLYVDEGEIEISLYDNGEVDNDTVTVYHNNELVINHGRLSTTPLTVRIKVDAQHPIHEFVMVADNLGEIPPNTSLMTIAAGKKQYSVFLTSDTERNAKIILQYKPQQEQSKFK
jgi:hypothetical protein